MCLSKLALRVNTDLNCVQASDFFCFVWTRCAEALPSSLRPVASAFRLFKCPNGGNLHGLSTVK